MLVESVTPWQPTAPVVEVAASATAPTNAAEPAKALPAPAAFADDDDEALQAVLLASLQESMGDANNDAASTAAVPQLSASAQAEQEARFNAAVKPP